MTTREAAGLTRRNFLKVLGGAGAAAAFTRIAGMPWPAQAQDHVTDTYIAIVDTIFPATPGTVHATGASAVRTHEFLMDAFDTFLAAVPTQAPGARLREAVAALVDAHAMQVTPGKTFVDQTFEERVHTLAALDSSPLGDVRFISLAIYGMTSLGFYSEWPAYGRRASIGGSTLPDPGLLPVWGEIGYPGPKHLWPPLFPYNPGEPIDPTQVS